jgi:predicted oxidoreductase
VSLSRLAAGCWRLVKQSKGELATVHRFIDAALELGITTFDHADIYGDFQAEALFGRALKERPSLRDKMELVTKCSISPRSVNRPATQVSHLDSGSAYIIASVERSLAALGVEQLDVLLMHRPDLLMDADDTAAALVRLREQEKVKAFGVSNFSARQFALLQSRVPFPLVTNQLELSLLATEPMRDGTLDQLQELRRSAMAWSPLAGGRLMSSEAPPALSAVLARLAAQYGVEPSAIGIAWLLRLPAPVVPVLGTIDPARLKQAARAATITLDRQDWYELYGAAGNRYN